MRQHKHNPAVPLKVLSLLLRQETAPRNNSPMEASDKDGQAVQSHLSPVKNYKR